MLNRYPNHFQLFSFLSYLSDKLLNTVQSNFRHFNKRFVYLLKVLNYKMHYSRIIKRKKKTHLPVEPVLRVRNKSLQIAMYIFITCLRPSAFICYATVTHFYSTRSNQLTYLAVSPESRRLDDDSTLHTTVDIALPKISLENSNVCLFAQRVYKKKNYFVFYHLWVDDVLILISIKHIRIKINFFFNNILQ